MNAHITGTQSPPPAGPYSHVVRLGGVVATAGQVGIDPQTGHPVGDDVASQTSQAIDNLVAALADAEVTLADVLRVNVYLTDPSHFAAMNEAYAQKMTEPYPARTTVYVGLNPGLLVEIDALAVAP